MPILLQFLLRIAFGLSFAMAVTSPRRVTSGYFRVHLYVVLGLNTLALMVAFSDDRFSIWPALVGAVLSYLGTVFWLTERTRAGRVVLVLVAASALVGCWESLVLPPSVPTTAWVLWMFDPLSGGLVLGCTLAAMFLGHWYLNTPTMQLAPLRRLVLLLGLAVLLRMVLGGAALGFEISHSGWLPTRDLLFVMLRWLSGLLGALVLAWMTWQTLKVPNTQSATGILYVAVIATFLGELTAQLLSAHTVYPI